MLDALRASSQTWIGRVIMAIVMGFLIIAFGFWGIADIFRGFGANTLAHIGSAEITQNEYRDAYQRQLLRLQEQERRPISSAEAHERGLDRDVLRSLLSNAALDQEAHRLGLAISDSALARRIMRDDAFKGPNGQFDKSLFEMRLQDNGMTEHGYVASQRNVVLREQIATALTDGLAAPRAMLEIINRYYNERRGIDYFILPKSAAGTIPAPSAAQLKSYFDAHREIYRKPEYRKISLLVVTPESLARIQLAAHPISEAEVKKHYDEVKDQHYTTAERRQLQQIVFPDEKSAEAAEAKLSGGETFDALITERKLTPKDTDLGTVTQSSLVDKGVAAAAFALPAGGVSKPVKTQFGGWAILHVQKITPKFVIPFIAVKEAIAHELALDRARKDLSKVHDEIEDQRASGKSVADAAKAVGLSARTIDAIDADGRDKAGHTVPDLGDPQTLLKAVFASDIGVDNDPISMKDGGTMWFDVLNISPAHDQTLDEVKARVTQDWTTDETKRRLVDKAVDLTKKLDGGASIASIAAAEGNLPVKHIDKITRADSRGLSSDLTGEVFNRHVDKSGSAEAQDGGRIIFKVTSASVPPLDVKHFEFRNVFTELKTALDDDMTAQFVTQLETRLGARINPQVWRSVAGAQTGQD